MSPRWALPWKLLPQHNPIVPRVENVLAQEIFHKDHHFNWLILGRVETHAVGWSLKDAIFGMDPFCSERQDLP